MLQVIAVVTRSGRSATGYEDRDRRSSKDADQVAPASVVIPVRGPCPLLSRTVHFYQSQDLIAEVIIADGSSRGRGSLELSVLNCPKLRYMRIPKLVNESLNQHFARRIAMATRAVRTEYVVVSGGDDFFLPSFVRRAIRLLGENDGLSVVLGTKLHWRNLGAIGREAALHPKLPAPLPYTDAPTMTASERLQAPLAPPWRCWSVGRRREVSEYWSQIAPVLPRGRHLGEFLLHASARIALPTEVIKYPMILRYWSHLHVPMLFSVRAIERAVASTELDIFLRVVTRDHSSTVSAELEATLRQQAVKFISQDASGTRTRLWRRESKELAAAVWYGLPLGLWKLNDQLHLTSMSSSSRAERVTKLFALYSKAERAELHRDFREVESYLGSFG